MLATDGVWDVLSNETVAQVVTNHSHDLKWSARQLCREAYLNGSSDNISAVVVDLRTAGRREERRMDG